MVQHWYFSRIELAEHYFDLLDREVFVNFAVICEKNMGKTLFALNDMDEAGRRRGYFVAYSSLSKNPDRPHLQLIECLRDCVCSIEQNVESLRNKEISDELWKRKTFKYDSWIMSPCGITTEEKKTISDLVSRLIFLSRDRKVLLIIDDFHHLALSEKFNYLKRILIDLSDAGLIKIMLIGSSRPLVNFLLADEKSCLNGFSDIVAFPYLGDTFVSSVDEFVLRSYRKYVDTSVLINTFNEFDKSPYWFYCFCQLIILSGLSPHSAFVLVSSEKKKKDGFLYDFPDRFNSIEEYMYMAVLSSEDVFSKEFYNRVMYYKGFVSARGGENFIAHGLKDLIKIGLVEKSQNKLGYVASPKSFIRVGMAERVVSDVRGAMLSNTSHEPS